MNKKVALGVKPATARAEVPQIDEWVKNRETENMKRLTIDIPFSLHTRIKSQCALRGVKMADQVRELLEKQFPSS
ncbi:hypothetical protein [Candidatus Contendibacter odensensis]|jgi:predicted DNA binding CopG/RHH family protein|uniref:Chromosome partitioning protein ParB n=1 Tax=Candidatus Contendobacter odensis Run_B_J11 TaxID=1400861 RepID=A0A7U7GBP3_9GAMM|nr:hypothetical protein [Candidatus Contendobacter odensis]CDH45385.1 conserved hypothetical protein [Candidatus Contendobacter odensis Run_B_J11]